MPEEIKNIIVQSGVTASIIELIRYAGWFVLTIATWYGGTVLRKIKAQSKNKIIREVAESAVKYVEQLYRNLNDKSKLNNEERFEIASRKMIELLEQEGINMIIEETRIYIEEAVFNMNNNKINTNTNKIEKPINEYNNEFEIKGFKEDNV